MIDRLEFLHNKHIIHCGMKPGNFLVGHGKNQNVIHLIDFVQAKSYRKLTTSEHIPYKDDK